MKNILPLLLACLLAACVSPMPEVDLSHAKGETLMHNGVKRHYLVSDPDASARKKPLVVFLHGLGATPEAMARAIYGRFEELSRQEGFIIVYPSGAVGKSWNDKPAFPMWEAHEKNIDDSGFLSTLIDKMVAEHGADPSRVYFTGPSNGAAMTYRFACDHPGKLRAIAAFIGTIDETVAKESVCGTTPLPVLIVNGTEDPFVEWKGYYRKSPTGQPFKFLSAQELLTFWADHNGCKKMTEETPLQKKIPEDDTYVTQRRAFDCRGDAEVILYGMHGAGHTWPSGWQYLPEMFIGATTHEINGADLAWSFFKRHP